MCLDESHALFISNAPTETESRGEGTDLSLYDSDGEWRVAV